MIRLNRELFRNKIYDYSNSKEWKFKGDKPTILTFYLKWFEGCKVLLPIIEEFAEREDIDVYKIDAELNPELAGIFGVEGIPMTLFIDKDGNINGAQGALTRESIDNLIKTYLTKENPAPEEDTTNVKNPESELSAAIEKDRENSKPKKSGLVDMHGNPL